MRFTINLIAVFDWYLMITFIVGTVLRIRQYYVVLRFVFAFPNRYPKLYELAKQHRTIFLGWPTLLPIAVTFLLMLIHSLMLRMVWRSAEVTPAELWSNTIGTAFAIVCGAGMLYFDFRATFLIAKFDRSALEPHLDRAEYWLQTKWSTALRIVTIGWLNPRKMVHEELRKSLTDAALSVTEQMWWWAMQIGLRFLFGLSLWVTWLTS